jgi:hypothetical protein
MNALDLCYTPVTIVRVTHSRAAEHDCTIYDWNCSDGNFTKQLPATFGFIFSLKHGTGVRDVKSSEALRSNGNTLDSHCKSSPSMRPRKL